MYVFIYFLYVFIYFLYFFFLPPGDSRVSSSCVVHFYPQDEERVHSGVRDPELVLES